MKSASGHGAQAIDAIQHQCHKRDPSSKDIVSEIGHSVKEPVHVCPCHTSTFRVEDGERLSGPAPRGLCRFRVTKVGDASVEIAEVEEDVLICPTLICAISFSRSDIDDRHEVRVRVGDGQFLLSGVNVSQSGTLPAVSSCRRSRGSSWIRCSGTAGCRLGPPPRGG